MVEYHITIETWFIWTAAICYVLSVVGVDVMVKQDKYHPLALILRLVWPATFFLMGTWNGLRRIVKGIVS